MKTGTRLRLTPPANFHFWRTVFSHGWCALPPFSHDPENQTLSRTLELHNGGIVECLLRSKRDAIDVVVTSDAPLSKEARQDIRAQLACCLEFDFDLPSFYRYAARFPQYRWIPRSGAGRMLRSPTAFEDAVKILCTTNCTWALTTMMVTNLARVAGRSRDGVHYTFPSPAALAALSERELRVQCKTGYRAPYIKALAVRVASGEIDPEGWRTSGKETASLAEEIASVKGMGPYAVGNMLRLLYRHDSLALDSWVRAQFSRIHKRGRKVSDRVIERYYDEYGQWRGLLFWLEMIRSWHDGKFTL